MENTGGESLFATTRDDSSPRGLTEASEYPDTKLASLVSIARVAPDNV